LPILADLAHISKAMTVKVWRKGQTWDSLPTHNFVKIVP